MKAKKKTNHLQEEAEKIEHIPEEKNNGRDGQDKPGKAKKPRKNRFLARLRKTWERITGCMRCCTSIQKEISAEELSTPSEIIMEEELPTASGINMEEEVPTPSGISIEVKLPTFNGINVEEELPRPSSVYIGEQLPASCDINMEDSNDMSFTVTELTEGKEDNVEENQTIKTDNEEAEVMVTDSFVEKEIEAEYHRVLDLIHSQEDLYVQYYASQQEILATYDPIHNLIQITEDLHTHHYDTEDEEQQDAEEKLESKVGDDTEGKIEEDGEDGLENTGSTKESQRASGEMPAPSHISSRDNESSKRKENKGNKGENNSIKINEECRSEQKSRSKSSSLEDETPDELFKTSQSGSSDYKSDSCSLEEETPEELHKSTNISQSGGSEYRSDSCSLEEEITDELYKSTNTSQSGSSDYRSDFWSLEEEASEELYKSIKTSQSSSSDYRSDSCLLEEETPEELHKFTNTSQNGSSQDEEEPITSDICLEKLEQPGEETPATVPLTLQSFTFHRTLGEGSFGEVYLARDTIRKECVAVKVTNKDYFTNYGYSFAERNILELSHESPYLIHGLAAFHTENFVYYVMELATRGDLFDFMLKNVPLDIPTIQFIISEVICGTQFLHTKGIIHRDLKPGNILLTADGHTKITDFGLAVMGVYEGTKDKYRGTPAYMAPEMVKDEEHGRGVDYFAIGVILYKMYTSKLPFPGQNPRNVKYSIVHHTPLYPEFLTPDTVDILQGLLCKDQHYRLGVTGDIKKHTFFSDINWEDVEARRVEPPEIMTAAFVHLNMHQTLRYVEMLNYIRPEDQKIFKQFSFVCPDWSQHYHPVNNPIQQ